MITIKIDKEIAEVDYFEVIERWSDIIQYELKKTIKSDKLEYYYSFGSFLPKKKNKEDHYNNMWDETSKMLWDDRIDYELSKIRVDFTLKMDKFSMTDRMSKDFIPMIVINLVKEITKLKMMFECELNGITEVKESIPPLDKNYLDEDSVRELLKLVLGGINGEKSFDLDTLLDKISENGIESLTEQERNFLNKRSREI